MKSGVLVVNKPQGMTSHDVVLLIRRQLGVQRIGHAGSLDPMATGVLVLLIGDATKYQRLAQGHPKQYEAVIRLGMQTDTGDAWGKPVTEAPIPSMTREQVEAMLSSFIGQQEQTPPAFSAAKWKGKPLYWWTRKGIAAQGRARMVEIYDITLLELGPDRFRCRIACSAGTYIRTLAEAMAQHLGTVGHVCALTRLSVGPWRLEQALTTPQLASASAEAIFQELRSPHATIIRADGLARQ